MNLSQPTIGTIAKLVRGLTEPALLLDASLAYVDSNTAFADLCGVRARHIGRDGRHPLTLLHCEHENPMTWAQEAVSRRQSLCLAELKVTTGENTSLTVYQTFSPVDEADGRIVGVLVTWRNVTDESRLQGHYREMLQREKQRAEALEAAVAARTKDLMAALEQVTRLSRTDALTGVLNRRSFTEEAERALRLAERQGQRVGLVLFDLDHFKSVNDQYGHLAGDEVIKAAANALAQSLRDTDLLGRFGGEEFMALLVGVEPADVVRVAERCWSAVRELSLKLVVPSFERQQTVSAGTACSPNDGRTLDELMLRADQALYTAKAEGRDRVRAYRSDMVPSPPRTVSRTRTGLILDADEARARELAVAAHGNVDYDVCSTIEDFRRRCRNERFDVLIAAHALASGFGEDALHSSVGTCPEALRILVLDDERQFTDVSAGLPNAIDLCLLRTDAAHELRPAVEDGLTRREVSRERMLAISKRSLRVWNQQVRELERLLEAAEINFHFQPIVRLSDHSPFGQELFCRPNHTLFPDPLAFTEACLRAGLIWDFGRLVRRTALDALGVAGLHGCLFVNLHPAELTDPHFARSVPPDAVQRLVFELNERGSVSHIEETRRAIEVLRSEGFRFAIDDLGAGHASLNAVAITGAEFIKLDLEMVRGLALSTRRRNLVKRIIQFAHDEGIVVIAEGIEAREDAEILRELGCDCGQGYFFGRPTTLSSHLIWSFGEARRS